MRAILLFCFVLFLQLPKIKAQSASQSCNCCNLTFHQFDFWLGEWEVFNKQGIKVGENEIISMQDSCVLQENWKSVGNTGTSYNYFDKSDSTWNQIYIDNVGTILNLKGKFENQKMVLESEKIKSLRADFYYFNRITWQQDSLGNVSQTWDIVDDKGNILQVAFDGIYKKKLITNKTESMKKVTGIGGIFFKCKDPETMKNWYKNQLGLKTDEYGAGFEWRQGDDASKYGFTQWSPFNENTKYFEPSTKEFMINYRVENLELLVQELKREGVIFTDEIATYDYGKFVHILDPEGNKIELWEPIDESYDKIVEGRTK
jgi:predicted enzyme related to lactoylglutathione lyase